MPSKARSPAVATMSAEQRRDACRRYVDLLLDPASVQDVKAFIPLRHAARALGKKFEDMMADARVVCCVRKVLNQIERERAIKSAAFN